MELHNKSILVTGANRGIGAALVRALLKRDIRRIYAASRQLDALPAFGDRRVLSLKIDVTSAADVDAAASEASDIDLLINNAGVAHFNTIVTGSPRELRDDMEVNYYGTLRVIQAFAPLLIKRGGGLIANIISVVGLAPMFAVGGYSASKAALYSATLAARAELKPNHIQVVGIFPGPIDTDMAKGLKAEKTSAESAAEAIVRGFIAGDDDIYPDATSAQIAGLWLKNPKGVEHLFASMPMA